jgi:hypothetical protein
MELCRFGILEQEQSLQALSILHKWSMLSSPLTAGSLHHVAKVCDYGIPRQVLSFVVHLERATMLHSLPMAGGLHLHLKPRSNSGK